MQNRSHLDVMAVGLMLVLCLSWGGQQVAVKLVTDDVSPLMQGAIRSIVASILVVAWALATRQSLVTRDRTLRWGLAAGTLFAVEFMFVYWGLGFTNASRAIVYFYMSPFFVALGSQWFIPGERLVGSQFAGLGLAFAGLLFVFGDSLSLPDRRMLIGDLMLIWAAVLWGATTVVIKAGPLARASPAKILIYQLGLSAVLLPIASVALGEPGIVRISAAAVWSLAYQAVWIAFVTYLAWFWLIRRYPAAKLASFTFLTPVFGVLAGWAVLDEALTPGLVVALFLVATGVWLVNRRI